VIALVEYIKNLNSNYRIEQTLNTTDLLPESEGKTAPAATGSTAGQKAAPPKTEPQGMVKQ
jgi:cytochrome c oxidase subunit II